MMPTTCDGRRCSKGKRNPVTLVRTVVTRKIEVAPSKRSPISSPYTTRKPEPIPTRLINTCTRVNVDVVMPKIMFLSFRNRDFACLPEKISHVSSGRVRAWIELRSSESEPVQFLGAPSTGSYRYLARDYASWR